MMRVIGVAAGPEPDGRTSMAVAAVLDGVRGATTGLLELSRTGLRYTTREIADADAIVFGSPVYRAICSGLLKHPLEGTERGMKGESTAPLRGKTAAVVLTGAGPHHFLAVADLRNVLASFFAVQVLSPGLYLDDTGYTGRHRPDRGEPGTSRPCTGGRSPIRPWRLVPPRRWPRSGRRSERGRPSTGVRAYRREGRGGVLRSPGHRLVQAPFGLPVTHST